MQNLKPPETLIVTSEKLSCDGDSLSGHPRVFLTMAKSGSVDCPYCGRHFVLAPGAHAEVGH